ncbi:MAG: DUF4956 domain-containing protein [Oscillospiraceae bacterium]|nr:DUF4956 domain-containing protein [Oscillospiraceae bacterium]
MFDSIFDQIVTAAGVSADISNTDLIICTVVSLLAGCIIAFVCRITNKHSTKSMLTTLVLLPVIVQIVIMLVNGNLGVGVSVMGAFSLVRFRSIPGTGKEIAYIFFAMSIGLATGTGFVGVAIGITLGIGLVMIVLNAVLGSSEEYRRARRLRIIIPEDLDFTGVFDDLFEKYTTRCELERVKTTNMGSLFELTYGIVLKDISKEKEFIDEIRCRNGNLTIICGIRENAMAEL